MAQLNDIHKILDLYWSGESSLEQEKILRDYFQRDDIDPSLAPYRGLFNFFSEEKKNEIKLEDLKLPFEEESHGATVRRLRPFQRWIGVAASIILLIGFFWVFQTKSHSYNDTYQDPELAWEQTKEALYFLSNKMDKGAEESVEQIKQLERLDLFN